MNQQCTPRWFGGRGLAGVVRRRGSAVLVARRVYWAPLQAGLVADRFRWGVRCIYLVARLVGLAPYCVGLVACWFGLVAQ